MAERVNINERVDNLCRWLHSIPPAERPLMEHKAKCVVNKLNQRPDIRTGARLIADGLRIMREGREPEPFLRAAHEVMRATGGK